MRPMSIEEERREGEQWYKVEVQFRAVHRRPSWIFWLFWEDEEDLKSGEVIGVEIEELVKPKWVGLEELSFSLLVLAFPFW